MDAQRGVMNSLKDSIREIIVSDLNTLSDIQLQWTISDWEANAKFKNLDAIEEMVLDLARVLVAVRQANSVLSK